MRILGIGDHVNCGSALLENGKVVAAINDERLVREKMVFGFPRESIKEIFRIHDLKPEDIDAVAVATRNQHFIGEYLDFKMPVWTPGSRQSKCSRRKLANYLF